MGGGLIPTPLRGVRVRQDGIVSFHTGVRLEKPNKNSVVKNILIERNPFADVESPFVTPGRGDRDNGEFAR